MSNTSGTSSVLDTARNSAAEAGLDPAKLAQDVGSRIKDVAEAQKNAGAEKVLGVARAIRSAADNVEQESPEVARYVRSAASSIESFTRDFNDRSVDDLGQAVVDMARRSPGLFFAGSMLAGFALFRFLNAAQSGVSHGSAQRRNDWSSRRGAKMESGARQSLTGGSGQGGYGSASAGGYDAGPSTGQQTKTQGAGASGAGSTGSSSQGGYGGGAQGAQRQPSSATQGGGKA